jgi:hypothetical protein
MRANPHFSVDPYLARAYSLADMNCWHMVRDAWLELTGIDLGDRTPARITAATLNATFGSDVPAFERLDGAQSPCLVLMRSPGAVPHVGLFLRGRVLQMTAAGASYMPLAVATAGFREIGFYR